MARELLDALDGASMRKVRTRRYWMETIANSTEMRSGGTAGRRSSRQRSFGLDRRVSCRAGPLAAEVATGSCTCRGGGTPLVPTVPSERRSKS